MKRTLSLCVLFAGCLAITQLGTTRAQPEQEPQKESALTQERQGASDLLEQELVRAELERSARGLAMSPVPVNAGVGRTRVQIGLGSYLVNTACVSCHTNPTYQSGGNPYFGQPEKVNTANFLAGGATFGPFLSRNLTPDPKKDNLPAGLTLDEFKHIMRTGEDDDHLHPQFGPLLQVMPWPEFSKLSERDLEAMYAYLRVIPHAEPGKQ